VVTVVSVDSVTELDDPDELVVEVSVTVSVTLVSLLPELTELLTDPPLVASADPDGSVETLSRAAFSGSGSANFWVNGLLSLSWARRLR
jgi:hypothetical protein